MTPDEVAYGLLFVTAEEVPMKCLLMALALASGFNLVWAEPTPAPSTRSPDYQAVDGAVFRGGQPTSEDLLSLATHDVNAVIDLEGGDIHGKNPLLNLFNYLREPGERKGSIKREEVMAEADGIKNFYDIPLNSTDKVSASEVGKIDQVLTLLHDADPEERVYVHCEHGRDRTGLIVALYQVKYHHMTPDEAHEQMVSYGHQGVLDSLFTKNLDRFFWKVAPSYYEQAEQE
jgi:protein tyrosine/serine phosphatase